VFHLTVDSQDSRFNLSKFGDTAPEDVAVLASSCGTCLDLEYCRFVPQFCTGGAIWVCFYVDDAHKQRKGYVQESRFHGEE
jgi:hypothetical protein